MLRQWSSGDLTVVDQLTPLVYDELHRLAGAYMQRERPDHTLRPTALIHEAYLRLIDQGQPEWRGRSEYTWLCDAVQRQSASSADTRFLSTFHSTSSQRRTSSYSPSHLIGGLPVKSNLARQLRRRRFQRSS
jgi:ECF sigma factor